jgi:tryptophan synthase beta subunit
MSKGRFGIHGGQYIPETLMNAVIELEKAYNYYKNDKEFNDELNTLLTDRFTEQLCRSSVTSVLRSTHDRRPRWSKSLSET